MLFFNSSSILHQKVQDRNRDTPALWLMDLGKTLGIFSEFFTIVGLEVTSKSPVLSVACHKFQSVEKACSVLRITHQRRFCHVLKCCSYVNTVPQLKPKLNSAEAKKPFYEFSFIKKAGAALVRTITSKYYDISCYFLWSSVLARLYLFQFLILIVFVVKRNRCICISI